MFSYGNRQIFFWEEADEKVQYSSHAEHLQIFILGKFGLLIDINELCGNSQIKLCSMVNPLPLKLMWWRWSFTRISFFYITIQLKQPADVLVSMKHSEN